MRSRILQQRLAALLAAAACCAAAAATGSNPVVDTAYPGTIGVAVDLRDTAHRVFQVKESIPAQPGPLSLHYPQWIPGEHGPGGKISNVTGLVVMAAGQPIPWHRDLVDMYTVRLEVPPDVHGVELSFQFLSPGHGAGSFTSGKSVSDAVVVLEWHQVLFYPAGYRTRHISVAPSVIVPPGWKWASALEALDAQASPVQFRTVSVDTLVDSPLTAGRHFRRLELGGDPMPVRMDIFADRPANLSASEQQVRSFARLVQEAGALFGGRHYQHYDFLFALSDHLEKFGLEHAQSSDDRIDADFFTDGDIFLAEVSLLSHEFVHSWNGKFRRPNGLLIPDLNTPFRDELLWVYEGLTNYLGEVLAARSGLIGGEQFRDVLAQSASEMEFSTGRIWRTLQDTADGDPLAMETPTAWANWRRGEDFYDEGTLLWLDVDTLLREQSHGQRSLDDFVRAFFGRDDGAIDPVGYGFDDVVLALDRVQHYDWAHYLRERLDAKSAMAPLDGIVRAGWKLEFVPEQNAYAKARDKEHHTLTLSASIGAVIDLEDGANTFADITWNGPAFQADIAPGMRILAVDGTRFTPGVLLDAIAAARSGSSPIEILLENDDQFRTATVDYHGGLRFAHLTRLENTDERLGAIAAAHAH